MQVELLHRLQAKPAQTADRVVVRNRFGDIMAVVVEFQPDQFVTTTAGDADFDTVLKNLGLKNTLTVDQMSGSDVPRIG